MEPLAQLVQEEIRKATQGNKFCFQTGKHSTCRRAALRLWAKWSNLPDLGGHLPAKGVIAETERDRAAVTIAYALSNHNFDGDRFAEKAKCSPVSADNSARLEKLKKYFNLPNLGSLDEPCTLVDREGRVLLWHLPSLISPSRVTYCNQSLIPLRAQLEKSLQSTSVGTSWRLQGFLPPEESQQFGRGKLTVSLAHFMQNHERILDPIVRSPCLRDSSVTCWLKDMGSLEALLEEVTGLVHPSLKDAGEQAVAQLVKDGAEKWPTSFTGFEIIVNRTTPWHQDSGSSSQSFDLLLSLGSDHQARLEVSELQASFGYQAGTAIYLPGRILRHAVHLWEGGERIALGHFTKDGVHDRLCISQPKFPRIQQYFP